MKEVELTCKSCRETWDKELEDDQFIGKHKNVKQGVGLAQRDPDDIVTRTKGYGTMPVVRCPVCGGAKHKFRSK